MCQIIKVPMTSRRCIGTFQKSFPNFVSKKELGKGIPSVSYNLRHGDNVLIDRSDPRQAINTLMKFGRENRKENLTAVIFPEGTRSKIAIPKPFEKVA